MDDSNWLIGSALVLVAPLAAACATGGVTTSEEIQAEFELPPFEGTPATVAVGSCEDRSAGAANFTIGDGDQQIAYAFTSEVGSGMADMMVTGLLNTDRFRVLETRDMASLEREQAYLGEEAQDAMAGADLVVTCAVTSVEPDAGGVGGGALNAIGSLVGAGGGIQQAEVELDIRLVDVETREILTSFQANGSATDAAVLGLLGGGGTAGLLGGYSNTPIEGAVKKAIWWAAEELAKTTPEEYFGGGG